MVTFKLKPEVCEEWREGVKVESKAGNGMRCLKRGKKSLEWFFKIAVDQEIRISIGGDWA